MSKKAAFIIGGAAVLGVAALVIASKSTSGEENGNGNGDGEDIALVIGLVRDQSLAPVNDAIVTVNGHTAIMGSNGHFSFSQVFPPGLATMNVAAPGFDEYNGQFSLIAGENNFVITLVPAEGEENIISFDVLAAGPAGSSILIRCQITNQGPPITRDIEIWVATWTALGYPNYPETAHVYKTVPVSFAENEMVIFQDWTVPFQGQYTVIWLRDPVTGFRTGEAIVVS